MATYLLSGEPESQIQVIKNEISRVGDIFKLLLENLVKIRGNKKSEDFCQIR